MSDQRRFEVLNPAALRGTFTNAYNVAKQFIEAGKQIEITIRERKSKRSVEQNKRYWSMLREIAATVWIDGKQFSDETWHEYFKRVMIGANEYHLPDGTTEMKGISTTTLNTGEFSTYMDRIEQWCAERGYVIGIAA